MKKGIRGALIGGIVGFIISIIFYNMNLVLGHSSCVKGLNLDNFFCSLSATWDKSGFLAMIFSIPYLFFENLFNLSGMSEIAILPLMIFSGLLIGGVIGYYHKKKNEK